MRAALGPFFLLASSSPVPAKPVRFEPSPTFDALTFFTGRTEGNGRLHVILSRARAVHVRGSGEMLAHGWLRLVQTVDEEGKPPVQRQWMIRRAASGHYVGWLSDAREPVVADTEGSRLRIRFRMAHGLRAEQWLVLRPDGQAARNRMTVRKFGIVVATLDESIVRGS